MSSPWFWGEVTLTRWTALKRLFDDQALLNPNWCAVGRNAGGLERVRATSRTISLANGVRKSEVSGINSTPVYIKKITE